MIDEKCSLDVVACNEKFAHFHFSDFMQKGASLPASQLIKVLTRGRMSRLSAEPLLEFFRPLEAWLELQNRDETVSKSLPSFRIIHEKSLIAGNRMVVKYGRRSVIPKSGVECCI